MVCTMSAARHPWFAWFLAVALALLPLHAMAAKQLHQAMQAGDCHGSAGHADHGKTPGKTPDKTGDIGAPACPGCSACHAVETVSALDMVLPGYAAAPIAEPEPVLHGLSPQPDLHPPLA